MSSDNAEQAIQLAEQLLALLELEATALAEQDLEQLQTLPDDKQSLLDALEQQQALLADCSPEQTAQLRHALEQCQDANQRNGRVIHHQQATTKNLLELLRGGQHQATYAPSGSRTSPSSLSLGLA